LRQALMDEVFNTLGIAGKPWPRRLLKPLLWTAATRFTRIAAKFEILIEKAGFYQAMRRILPDFVTGFQVSGEELVPREGPLLVVSNHPGTFDSLVIAANLSREDVSIIAGNYLFLKQLPHASRHLIFVSRDDVHDRMAVVRASIRHLRQGGALVLFPSGRVDPDPDFMPGAADELGRWSASLELFLRQAPQTRLLPTIVSGTMKASFVNSPLMRLWKGRWERQRAAEILQVARQMSLPFRLKLVPRMTFGAPISAEELLQDLSRARPLEGIIEAACKLLARHRLLWGIEAPGT
jgi:1-acyl-sn-glycerol-3-phosphate acyltransferase